MGLTQSVFKVVLHKPTPPQTRQLILHISNSKGRIVGFWGEITFANYVLSIFGEMKTASGMRGVLGAVRGTILGSETKSAELESSDNSVFFPRNKQKTDSVLFAGC